MNMKNVYTLYIKNTYKYKECISKDKLTLLLNSLLLFKKFLSYQIYPYENPLVKNLSNTIKIDSILRA